MRLKGLALVATTLGCMHGGGGVSSVSLENVIRENQSIVFSPKVTNNLLFLYDGLDREIVLCANGFKQDEVCGEVDMGPYENLGNGSVKQIFLWGNFTNCNSSNSRFFDPFNYFNSYCVSCVRNALNNNTVTG